MQENTQPSEGLSESTRKNRPTIRSELRKMKQGESVATRRRLTEVDLWLRGDEPKPGNLALETASQDLWQAAHFYLRRFGPDGKYRILEQAAKDLLNLREGKQ